MAATISVKIFLSTVSDEFRAYRDRLRTNLTRPNVEVKVQEDFKDLGRSTLDKLDHYIAHCDAVVHLVGDMTGGEPGEHERLGLVAKYPDLAQHLPPLGEALANGASISYTQWEAWLALYHGKSLFIAKAAEEAPRGPKFEPTNVTRAAQAAHLARLKAYKRFPGCNFTSADNLTAYALGTAVVDLLAKARAEDPQRQPRNLPYASLGSLFKGREGFLETLHETLRQGGQAAVTGKALHGLGGIGKTRLAIEYAWRCADTYSALLFVSAETPVRLNAGLAALAGPDILDLPEKDAKEDEVKIHAALGWLARHPTWLMIVDNVDDAKAAAALEELIPSLHGGHVLITARMTDFSGAITALPLDYLSLEDSIAFLLERTDGARVNEPGDNVRARSLARELGGLALGLEQAGAYIAKQRIGFNRYLKLWYESRIKVLRWFDRRLTSYNHNVGLAATWTTSVAQLTPGGRRLLERCAFFAPEPLPDFLLDVKVPEDGAAFDAHEARADLLSYSLASQVAADEGQKRLPGFAVHRLVQDFTRRGLAEDQRAAVLQGALDWMDAAFTGDPLDVRTWPQLDPLAAHALAVADHGDKEGVVTPVSRLYDRLGTLFQAKARYAEAEPLFRRALAIDEASYGPDHPDVAIRLNNLAGLLKNTNRIAEAERLSRRQLEIFLNFTAQTGHAHPHLQTAFVNYANILAATGRSESQALAEISALATKHGMNVQYEAPPEAASGAVDPHPAEKIPRNAPCPCGSGKRYKHCHGALGKKQAS